MDIQIKGRAEHKAIAYALVLLMLWLGAAAHAGTVTYVYTDAQGTPLAEADANGNITATFDYAPYGSQALGTPSSGPGYTGHVNDPDTGLVYMQHRYYDPTVGRFLSVDSVVPAVGNLFNFNRYDYANDNPIVNIDLDGRETGRALQSINWGVQYPQVPADPAGKVIAGATVGLVAVPIVYLLAPETTVAAFRNVIRQVARKIIADNAHGASRSLKDQAADLVGKNGGKNRVTIESLSQRIEIDLAGKSHGGIETPHVKVSERNLKAPNQPAYNTKSAQVRAATQDDIDMAARHLDKE